MAKAKKAEAEIIIPSSYDAANDVLADIGKTERDLAKLEARLALKVAKLTALIEKSATPLKARRLLLQSRLMAYAEENRDALLKDDAKHHDMPAGRIGWRTNPPSVSWKSKFKVEDILRGIVAVAKRLNASKDPEDHKRAVTVLGFVRVKQEPNKEAMLAAPALALTVDGVKIGSSGEQFYIEPKGAQLSEGAP